MAASTLRYWVGNEHNPGDPWGRSELVIGPDGAARLDHYFSRGGGAGSWTGLVDAAALGALRAALDLAGFPAAPQLRAVGGATLRHLTVEADGVGQQVTLDWHQTASLPGYAMAFDVLDGVIRQLSSDAVQYPTTQPAIVSDIEAV